MEQSIVSVKKNHSIKKIRTVNGADFFYLCVADNKKPPAERQAVFHVTIKQRG